MKNKINLIKKVNVFSKLQKQELRVIAENSDLIEYKKGSKIYSDGSTEELENPDWFDGR